MMVEKLSKSLLLSDEKRGMTINLIDSSQSLEPTSQDEEEEEP